MAEIDYVHYDATVDHLTIYKKDEQIVSNVDTGLAIVSLNGKKEIVGFEFMGAHKNFKIPLDVLKQLKGCKVQLEYNPERKVLVISVTLQYPKNETPLVYSSANIDFGNTAFSERFAASIA